MAIFEKFSTFSLVQVLAVSLASCSVGSSSQQNPDAQKPVSLADNHPLKGKLNGSEFVVSQGVAFQGSNAGQLFLRFMPSSSSDPCAEVLNASDLGEVSVEVESKIGTYDKSGDDPIILTYKSEDSEMVHIPAWGQVRIDSLDDSKVTGAIAANFNEKNYLSGAFEAKMCRPMSSPQGGNANAGAGSNGGADAPVDQPVNFDFKSLVGKFEVSLTRPNLKSLWITVDQQRPKQLNFYFQNEWEDSTFYSGVNGGSNGGVITQKSEGSTDLSFLAQFGSCGGSGCSMPLASNSLHNCKVAVTGSSPRRELNLACGSSRLNGTYLEVTQ